MKKIILTGGGTAGHVTPNIALLPRLASEGYKIVYIGSHSGIEKELITKCRIPYHGIATGKLRRYLDPKNVTDLFRVIKGMGDAMSIIKKEKPDIIFSKGGFVAVPVVVAGWLMRVPVVIHESDLSPGLANRLSAPFAREICAAFPETLEALPKNKSTLTGTPIRKSLFKGDRLNGMKLCKFDDQKPIVLIMGGSSGSRVINSCVRQALPRLLKIYQIVHVCGKGNVDHEAGRTGYKQFEYLTDELPHILAAADVIVSRSGANSISEFLALKKPSLLIPLSKSASRGDQILNAESFERQGFSKVLREESMTSESIVTEIIDLYANRASYIEKMELCGVTDAVENVVQVIKKHTV